MMWSRFLFFTVLIFSTTLSAQKQYLESEDIRKNWLQSLDEVDDNASRQTMNDKILSNFGLKAYRDNYLIAGFREGSYDNYTVSDEYTNKELEIQLSLRYDVTSNLFGLDEIYTLTYTHRAFWQIFTPSSPFRETNYNPEFFVTFPIYSNHWSGLKAIKIAPFAHQSNGQGNITESLSDINDTEIPENIDPLVITNRSRSWNYAYISLYFQYDRLFTELTTHIRYPESGVDDNPDLIDYIGHGSVAFYLPYRHHLFRLKGNLNIKTGNGAVEGTWSYPLSLSRSTYLYTKIFSGYGESLIDYNNYITKFSLGISFSR